MKIASRRRETVPSGHDIYCVYRDYIKHEDNLINNRVGWFIQLHSFLIATYGIIFASFTSTFAREAAAMVPGIRASACVLLAAISLVGIASSLSASLSIWAAHKAIKALNRRWDAQSDKLDPRKVFPGLIGGGNKGRDWWGASFHLFLPACLFAAWIGSFFLLYDLSYAIGSAHR
ncbi:hypothetical protein OF829_09550 [Sphingomonas sp. LB-2]|uniref:hypothetical protein n=1 Tax=Sphingomonas caeni TaxID=2984949 RepID=UPI002230A77E|nr:hypothetical protein [Sphingomonas caeni]MCW3847487.1 hypothetical protein [Sphingomonas caeni]